MGYSSRRSNALQKVIGSAGIGTMLFLGVSGYLTQVRDISQPANEAKHTVWATGSGDGLDVNRQQIGYLDVSGNLSVSGSIISGGATLIAAPSQSSQDERYVLNQGDTMTGTLAVEGAVTLNSSLAVVGEPRIAKTIIIPLCDGKTACAVGSGAMLSMRGQGLQGSYTLSGAFLESAYAGTTGTMTVQLRNLTDSADVFSTLIQLDTGETTSDTAAASYVIGAATFTQNDRLLVNIATVHTTPTKGTSLILDLIPQ